ncbi:unnamed protein product [Coregonus sp. 'balchen']|nr:unnamed protein product [Coregonus sp. 'balchen']
METDPALETCTESRAETGGERTKTREGLTRSPSPLSPNRSTAAHTPTTLISTPPQLNSSCPPKLTPAPTPSTSTRTLTPTFTPFSSSTPTRNPPKLTPTPSSPPTITRKTLPTLTPTVLNPPPTFTPTSPSLNPNPLTSKMLTPKPTPPILTPSLPTLKHSSFPSPTKLTHKPAPLPLTPPTLTPTPPLLTPSPSPTSPTVSAIPSLPPSATHGKMSFAPGTSFSLTNGNARPATTPTSPPITPFHTPASRQLIFTSTVRPVPSSSSSSSHPASAQLQSLTLLPSAPGTLTIPPSLRLKPPSSSSSSLSPISRPLTPLFPPLRPCPQPSAVATDRQTPPTRHLSVRPPNLDFILQMATEWCPRDTAPPSDHSLLPLPVRPYPADSVLDQPAVCHLKPLPTQSTPGQSQLSSGSRPLPLDSTSCFDRLPPASRQLQIIALSAGSTSRLSSQTWPAANTHTPASVQSKCLVLESPTPQLDAKPQRTSDHASPPPTSSIHKANSPLLYPHYQARNIQPKGEVGRRERRVGGEEEKMGEIEEGQRDKERVGGERQVTGEEKGIVEKRGERVGEKGLLTGEEKGGTGGEEKWMERVKQYERLREMTGIEEEGGGKDEDGGRGAEREDGGRGGGSPIDLQRPSDRPIERPPDLPHKDLCENMSTQSDNHSVLSSLSSQSPPASPCLTPPSDFPPPLLPVSPSHSETLSLSQIRPETLSISEREPWTQRVWPEGGRRVLTHLVEGFVIQEGLQAFPVNRSSLLLGGQEGVSQNGNTKGAELLPLTDTPEPPEHSGESERAGVATDDPLTGPRERQKGVLQCESCGKRGHAHSFHRSKRYCSTSCARSAHRHDYEGKEGHAVPITTRLERRAARMARRASEPAMTPSNLTVTSTEPTPAQWSIEQVWDFIHTLPGCVEVAEAFRVQEIDGQALLLLTEDHLVSSMNIKLGPALKICAHINTLRHT